HWFSTQNNAAPSHENPTNFVRDGRRVGPLEGYSCQLVADEAIGWLKSAGTRDRPFFLFVCFHEPHEKVAARKALGYLQAGRDPRALIDAARRLELLKGDDAHDYKFSSAVLEDYYHASPAWRDRYLASSLLLLPGSADRDNDLVRRTRAALQA